jgi:hypothetical protein
MLFPQRLGLPIDGKPHCRPVHIRIFQEKTFDFLLEGMIGIYGIEEVDKHRKDIVYTIITDGFVGEPRIFSFPWK